MDIKLLTEVEKASIGERQPLPERYLRLSDDEMDARIAAAKQTLGDRVVILGHHYQRDEVIKFADYIGDSLKLVARGRQPRQGRVHRLLRRPLHGRERRHPARAAPESPPARSRRRLLDGRHGRARSARHVLARARRDGRPHRRGRERTRRRRSPSPTSIRRRRSKRSSATHGGIVCTSTNAAAVMKWAWEHGEKLLMLPDQHLGRNTAFKMGVPLDEMVVWDPERDLGRAAARSRSRRRS